jgi:hypothetical protein
MILIVLGTKVSKSESLKYFVFTSHNSLFDKPDNLYELHELSTYLLCLFVLSFLNISTSGVCRRETSIRFFGSNGSTSISFP